MSYTEKDIRDLRKIAATLRGNLIEMIPAGKVGHLGGSSSIMDVTAALYFKHMKVFDDPKDPRRDRCVFSKGHAVLAQYAAFVELGYVSHEDLHKVKTLDGTLQGHPDMDHTPGIEAVTGSLGQGLSVSLGMALGLRVDGSASSICAKSWPSISMTFQPKAAHFAAWLGLGSTLSTASVACTPFRSTMATRLSAL